MSDDARVHVDLDAGQALAVAAVLSVHASAVAVSPGMRAALASAGRELARALDVMCAQCPIRIPNAACCRAAGLRS